MAAPRRALIPCPPQRGQALIEFAIVLFLLVILVVGGLELALAAYNSHRAAEGARAGAARWAEWQATGAELELGDHYFGVDDPRGGFDNPRCLTGVGYDHGLPLDGRAYLFNPLPLDITDCLGASDDLCTADPGDDRTRLSVLFTGYPDPGAPGCQPADYSGLPPVNQAIRSLYVKACVDGADQLVDCHKDSVARVYLKLPGGRHLQDDPANPSLLALFGEDNRPIKPNPLRPFFELQCSDRPDLEPPPEPACAEDCRPASCNVEVTVRYRHVFESLTLIPGVSLRDDGTPLWQDRLDDADLDLLDNPFVGPNRSPVRGWIGAEVTRSGNIRKVWRTFKGCYTTQGQVPVPCS